MNDLRKGMYAMCMTGVLIILALVWVKAHPPIQPDHYASVHPLTTMVPLMGFADDSVVNAGDEKVLDALPGVGPVIAARIIELCEALGGYRLPEDLLLVKGIGEKTLDKIMKELNEPLVLLDE